MSAFSELNSAPSGPGARLRLRMECNFTAVRRCARQIRAFLAAQELAEKDIWACELAFVEGCNNAVQHTPANRMAKTLLVEMWCNATQVELRINDHTHGFDIPAERVLPGPEQESGRGIFLMRSLMDQVDYIRSSSSNCLVLRKAVTGI